MRTQRHPNAPVGSPPQTGEATEQRRRVDPSLGLPGPLTVIGVISAIGCVMLLSSPPARGSGVRVAAGPAGQPLSASSGSAAIVVEARGAATVQPAPRPKTAAPAAPPLVAAPDHEETPEPPRTPPPPPATTTPFGPAAPPPAGTSVVAPPAANATEPSANLTAAPPPGYLFEGVDRDGGKGPDEVTNRLARHMRPDWQVPFRLRPLSRYYADHRQTMYGRLHYNFSVMSLAEFGSNETDTPDVPAALCELALATAPCCNVLSENATVQGRETAAQCLRRRGAAAMRRALPRKCTESEWFDAAIAATGDKTADAPKATPEAADPPLQPLGLFAAQTVDAAKYGYAKRVPKAEWPPHSFTPPVECVDPLNASNTLLVHPISFAIPSQNFLGAPGVDQHTRTRVFRAKLWDWAPLIPVPWPGFPGMRYPLGYEEEWLAKIMHERSFFAWTHRRGGWDCLRHYEILAAGCVPFFIDLPMAPPDVVTSLPRGLILEAMALASNVPVVRSWKKEIRSPWVGMKPPHKGSKRSMPLKFFFPGKLEHESFNFTRYFEIADEILEHSRKYLSTASLAAYVLGKTGLAEPKHVVLVQDAYDYLSTALLHGIYELGVPVTLLGDKLEAMFSMQVPDAKNASLEDLRRYRKKVRQHLAGGGWVYGFRVPTKPWQTRLYRIGDPNATEALAKLAREGESKTRGPPRKRWWPGMSDEDAALNRTRPPPRRPPLPPADVVIYAKMDKTETTDAWPLWNEVASKLPKAQVVVIDGWDYDITVSQEARAVSWARNGTLFKREIMPTTCRRRQRKP